jgi:hypothetical protein
VTTTGHSSSTGEVEPEKSDTYAGGGRIGTGALSEPVGVRRTSIPIDCHFSTFVSLLYPEDGGGLFSRNVGTGVTSSNLHSHRVATSNIAATFMVCK